jgi:hypothetical protein
MAWWAISVTGMTWMAMRGGPASHQIMARAGHLALQMSEHYRRHAELVGAGVGAPFPELPAQLVESSLAIVPILRKMPRKTACEGGDLNPHGSYPTSTSS